MTEKQQIGLEILKHRAEDKAYVYTLALWARQEGHINDEEYEIVKKELDEYYQETESNVDKQKNKYMMKVLDVIGFTPTRILWQLISQLPTRMVGDPANFELVPDNNKIIKYVNIPDIDYYSLINKIIDKGFLSKGKSGNKMTYIIDFHKIMSL